MNGRYCRLPGPDPILYDQKEVCNTPASVLPSPPSPPLLSMALRNLFAKLEVKPTDDEFESIETTRWGNKDVYPIPHDKRTYSWLAFYAYWGTCGISLSSWTIGSSLIGIGLTAGQACGVVIVGCVIASLSAYLNGAAGAIHHLGYGALARAAFGLWGSYFVVMLNVFQVR